MEDKVMEDDKNHPGDNPGLVRSYSNESDNYESLVKSVEDLDVKENIPTRPQAKELISKLISDLKEYDTTFLEEYLNVLQNSNQPAVNDVTNKIVFSIEEVVLNKQSSDRQWQEPVLVVLLGWMCVTVLCLTDLDVQSPYRALSELLQHTTLRERVRLARAFWRLLSPALLIELVDVTTRPKQLPAPEGTALPEATLSDLLLRAALSKLQPEQHEPQWHEGTLRYEEVATGLTSAWVDADINGRSLLVQVAGRTHSERALFDITKGRGTKYRTGQPETHKVEVEMDKVYLLCPDKNKIENTKKKSNKRKRKK